MSFTFAYGVLPTEFVPSSGLGLASDYGGIQSSTWADVVNATRIEIQQYLWPLFDRRQRPPLAPRDSLVTADLDLMTSMRPEGDWDLLKAQRSGSSTLGELFKAEDAAGLAGCIYDDAQQRYVCIPTGFEASFVRYALGGAPSFGPDLDQLGNVMFPATFEGVAWAHLSLKHLFQRPRPFQVAYERGYDIFLNKLSETAHSPSLPSGHCIESLFGALNAHFYMPRTSPFYKHRGVLATWAADVADRRVYAGLHYPSDNFASWFYVSHLIPVLFADQTDQVKAREFVVDSIRASACWTKSDSCDAYGGIRKRLMVLYKGLS